MKRAIYDKQFKMAAVKMSQTLEKSTQEVAKEHLFFYSLEIDSVKYFFENLS